MVVANKFYTQLRRKLGITKFCDFYSILSTSVNIDNNSSNMELIKNLMF